MKIITLLSQKGGSGKSTLTLCLGVYAESLGKDVLIIDLDTQSTSAGWYQRRKSTGKDSPAVIPAHGIQLPELLQSARDNDADYVFIDTAPHSADVAAKAVAASDLILIPCRPSIHDITAIENSVTIAKLHNTKSAVVINSIHPNAPQQFFEVSSAISDSYNVLVLPVSIPQRSEFMHSMTSGETPTETEPNGKDAGEIEALLRHISI